jgi:hypothetical protein
MKRLFVIGLALMACIGFCIADPSTTETPPIQMSNISIVSSNQTVVSQNVSAAGTLEALFIGVTNSMSTATNSVGILVQAINSMGITRTIYTNSALTASTVVYPAVNLQTVTGALAGTNTVIQIPLYYDQMQISAWNNGSTNTNVRAWGIIANP